MMEIWNRKDLEAFRSMVIKNKKIDAHLMSDIDLGGEIWEPIATRVRGGYQGHFEGNGHTISGLNARSQGCEGAGFFCKVSLGSVRNLTVEGVAVGLYNVGGITGKLDCAEITGCINKAKCDGISDVGGICGCNLVSAGVFENCINYGEITGQHPGGIIGSYDWREGEGVKIHNCRNEGTLFVQNCDDLKSVIANNYQYNQIGGRYDLDGTNRQNGKVITPFRNTLLGLHLNQSVFCINTTITKDLISRMLAADQNPEYVNENGDTYLHLLCQNIKAIGDKDVPNMTEIILLLATETQIDFGALNNDGKEAADFLKNSHGKAQRGFAPVIKLIEDVKKDKGRLGQDQESEDSFSDIGW